MLWYYGVFEDWEYFVYSAKTLTKKETAVLVE